MENTFNYFIRTIVLVILTKNVYSKKLFLTPVFNR